MLAGARYIEVPLNEVLDQLRSNFITPNTVYPQ